ncbi:glycoside hydrolase family 3 C-terminal domain-containing protein [Flavobacterium sp. J372]|uniref:glycoside hydrolase family 3 N-terminal domain-containing protein n=1 Tax=Flavobacterium sp. J372 TaxID=2898436 RepID=UPI0021512B81|nr:glycoside hydrolase family 3 N-terminal domain-containing protein [Flavobacterium sp. J372]MCR5862108.1 glycoside hydrolase family 3 C-terminal domain-containing protein [Flavobacterium sp. J372]
MRYNKTLLLLLACSMSLFAQKAKDNTKRDQFISGLMAKMTIDEKIAQTVQYTADGTVTGPKTGINYIDEIKRGNVGSILNATGVKYTRELQKLNLDNSRLKIPLIFGHDVIHGFRTIFPITLGEAASWDLSAVELSARVAAREAAAAGVHWTFAPMVDISRDPRWGRVSEGSGEDTYLGSKMAFARVRGFQGHDLMSTDVILACTKHFAAYGAAEAGRDYNTVDMSERVLRETYLPPFKATVDAGVGSFMTSFNEIAGVPATASKFLLRDILKKEWGFKGFVVTDYTAINELIPHGVARDSAHAGELAMVAGVDMEMVGGIYMKNLKKLLAEKRVTEAQINDACRRVLEAKYDLGLFTDPYRQSSEQREKAELTKKENLDAALMVANKSMVLLKNSNNVLPLRKEQKVAFVGPLVSDEHNIIGSWAATGDRSGFAVSVQEGVNKIVTDKNKVTFDKGVEIVDSRRDMMQAALNNARKADVIVAVMGEFENMTGEAASRTNIDLPGIQKEFLAELKKLGKPVVLVLMNGRPLTLTWENDNMDAILEAWYPGTMGGDAIAQTLYGINNPSGKLPMTFPRNIGQIPLYYNHKNTGRPYLGPSDPEQKYKSRYIDVDNSPLYPFGYGLSYSTFSYSNLKLSSAKMQMNGKLKVSVDVTNTGNYDGEEVIQLYVRDVVGSVTRPVKELKGFKKLLIKKGQKQTVDFELTTEDLKFYNIDMKFVAEPGDFEVFVGGSSDAILKDKFELVK